MEQNEVETTVNTAEPVEIVNTNGISPGEYREFLEFKAMKKVAMEEAIEKSDISQPMKSRMTINEEMAREAAIRQAKADEQKRLLKLANQISELDRLAERHLNFDKRAWLERNRDHKEIELAQKRGLVEKFLNREQIRALSGVNDINAVDGYALDQLLALAIVESEKMHQKATEAKILVNQSSGLSIDNSSYNLGSDYFYPKTHEQLVAGILNYQSQKARELGDQLSASLRTI